MSIRVANIFQVCVVLLIIDPKPLECLLPDVMLVGVVKVFVGSSTLASGRRRRKLHVVSVVTHVFERLVLDIMARPNVCWIINGAATIRIIALRGIARLDRIAQSRTASHVLTNSVGAVMDATSSLSSLVARSQIEDGQPDRGIVVSTCPRSARVS